MKWFVALLVLAVHPATVAYSQTDLEPSASTNSKEPSQVRTPIETFLQLIGKVPQDRLKALEAIERNWNDGDTGLLLETIRFTRSRQTRAFLFDCLARNTGQSFERSLNPWYRWIWNRNVTLHPDYATFKRELYQRIDPRFAEYFDPEYEQQIRWDEIRWGGVRRDGIPPLDHPKVLAASDADYLADSDVVFGVHFDGESRAYPKRILAWHEMVKDDLGGLSINGVYCTLCGSMIVYETETNGRHFELGTSGFLYRSNKLMYDHETQSLWSTLKGRPVVGPLVGQGIRLTPRHVVTTTWGEWKTRHPKTTVLSLETGHKRDYGEGVAYQDYFATDKLMFTVPQIDRRLKNKDEVLVVRRGEDSLAIAAHFLNSQPVYQDSVGGVSFVVITDRSGANRVYESVEISFADTSAENSIQSTDGRTWQIMEDALVSRDNETSGNSKTVLNRLSAHRAFWFGWYADHPDVRLVTGP